MNESSLLSTPREASSSEGKKPREEEAAPENTDDEKLNQVPASCQARPLFCFSFYESKFSTSGLIPSPSLPSPGTLAFNGEQPPIISSTKLGVHPEEPFNGFAEFEAPPVDASNADMAAQLATGGPPLVSFTTEAAAASTANQDDQPCQLICVCGTCVNDDDNDCKSPPIGTDKSLFDVFSVGHSRAAQSPYLSARSKATATSNLDLGDDFNKENAKSRECVAEVESTGIAPSISAVDDGSSVWAAFLQNFRSNLDSSDAEDSTKNDSPCPEQTSTVFPRIAHSDGCDAGIQTALIREEVTERVIGQMRAIAPPSSRPDLPGIISVVAEEPGSVEVTDQVDGTVTSHNEPSGSTDEEGGTTHHAYVGRRVAKYFQRKLYFGTIVMYYPKDDISGDPLWYVIYDDHDEEDLDASGVMHAMDLYEESQAARK